MKRVLIVEDSEPFRKSLEGSLILADAFEWEIEVDAPEGFDTTYMDIRTRRYDCIVVDFMLWENKTAIDIIRIAKKYQQHTSLVIVTGVEKEALNELGVDIRGIECVSKSDSKKHIVDVIIEAIKETERRLDGEAYKQEVRNELAEIRKEVKASGRRRSLKSHLTWKNIKWAIGIIPTITAIIAWVSVNILAPAVDAVIVTQNEWDNELSELKKSVNEIHKIVKEDK